MKKIFLVLLLATMSVACQSNDDADLQQVTTYRILSLGDSYTIGESVCDSCRFPEQLKDSLIQNLTEQITINLDVVAQTGWTTTNLKSAIEIADLASEYDLITLLIGVNNQYQGKPFSLYEEEFPELVNTALEFVNNDKARIIVVSIPDYAFTPFGQNSGNPETTSEEIDMYNTFAEDYCNNNNITFINITDITREGLNNSDLVASDGLHPSELAYTQFVERLLPVA
ncbi:SGNH/GDSL hydrolase family protein [Winogradskyella ouciana]|uniref:SGNH/GDSL hydrolase family protein n=1 Tax=Winogradskyella ouciana TaxID=2608631 RepID=A0A7K1GBA3_9FLAO|nr:SGNH/GDSL hydrolase family protein [Winogradskyella ouciana]MTE26325.1 SGNH/GDSL hydrolase family protein [Winogradskyella ouciana]